MKAQTFLPCASVLLVLISGCFSYRELPVEYDYSYKGRFDKYNSYDFLIQGENAELMSTSGTTIYNAIESHMKFLGYKKKSNRPDLLLSFRVFADSLNFRGYNQPKIEDWMAKKDRDLEYQRMKIGMKEGTLLIQIFDRKQKSSIWQGYATDYYGKVDFTDIRDVNNAVKSILNKYQFFADGFLEEQQKILSQ
ncbi:hypothetical protein GCM10009122_30790 [Fulvivirga kasyanovii]|uniref:DUF4136 domain-containing protein n=1 Tax=Fulvivirga kasyanovii TaxID=396812 RepID=A0ABW9RQA2_9BACT|nr:DUF4136 domain-containing protein [Fulvivirga kasyanovii]MTI26339.1 DUF4136 domain-containing protein [Fulvivirga kasyanovii]